MDRKRIENIMNKLKDISDVSYDEEFDIAVYIFLRYGKYEFDNYICNDELEKINKVLKRHSTIFDEDVNDEVRMILNDDEED